MSHLTLQKHIYHYCSVILYTDLISSFKQCIFVGDFNFPDINWSSLTGSSPLSNSFCEFIFDCNLTQHVMSPTHVKGNILDLILTSPDIDVANLFVHPSSIPLFSDHFIISFSPLFNLTTNVRSKSCYVFDYSRTDFEGIC